MLQTRLENEQFNSLPNMFPDHRSETGFITTNRPDSSQLVDLHIYIIPKIVWRNVQHLAQNEAMEDATSAGFVRVSPDMKLYKLRESIEHLCGKEIYFPRDFIFLRSVGRCLARVKPTQENELKVKNYRPPQTLASEIYLLEGRHEEYANIPSASPALSSVSYLFGSRYQHRFNRDDYTPSPLKLAHNYYKKPLHPEKNNLPIVNTNNFITRYAIPKRKNLSRLTQIGSDESSPNMSVMTSVSSRDLSKLKEEQERLRRRQAELERMRRAAEEKKVHSEREENERQRRRQEKVQSERDEEERRRRRRRQEKEEAERRRLEKQDLAATKIQASFRGFKDRQAFRERQRNLMKNDSRISSSKSNTTIKKSIKDDDDELSDGSQILSQTSWIGSTSDVDSNLSRPETRTIKKEKRKSIDSNSSSSLSSIKSERKIKSNLSSHSKIEETRSATVTKIRQPDEEVLSVSTLDINNNEDTYELERRVADVKRRQQTEEEKRKAKELEDQRRRELAKQNQREDVESLRARLHELRTGRVDLEKQRDEVIKRLKNVHHRITSRRKEARDMWKKKYFHEKKKTPAIQDHVTQLKTDLEQIQSKIIQTIDNECKHSAEVGFLKEAETGNLVLQIIRIQYDLQDIRHQVDQAKLRLTTDIKLRNQADNECRSLKHELSQAKMNLDHIKNRIRV